MCKSIQKETVSAVWAIAALLAFSIGLKVLGLFFAFKSVLDVVAAARLAAEEAEEREIAKRFGMRHQR